MMRTAIRIGRVDRIGAHGGRGNTACRPRIGPHTVEYQQVMACH
jgi:hypothetical protein